MRKLVLSALVAAALAVPAGSAAAADAQAGLEDCWAGQIGVVVWYWDHLDQEKVYYRLCIQTGP